jgi:RNA polymerase subunit RPABC4/transcription elongation factor Spt4
MLVRVCPDCGEEFRPDILRCSDCGAELVTQEDEDPALAMERPAHTGSLGSPGDSLDAARPIAWSDQARNLVPFADRLVEAGVVFRIGPRPEDEQGRSHGFELRVWDKDREAATRVLAPHATPESGVTLLGASAYPASNDPDTLACPACDAPVPTGTDECPECGLILGGGGGATEPSH